MLTPKPGVFCHGQIVLDADLAGQPEAGVCHMRRKIEAPCLTCVLWPHLLINLHGACATGAKALAVEPRRLTIMHGHLGGSQYIAQALTVCAFDLVSHVYDCRYGVHLILLSTPHEERCARRSKLCVRPKRCHNVCEDVGDEALIARRGEVVPGVNLTWYSELCGGACHMGLIEVMFCAPQHQGDP